jgi:hypothetical protein
MPVGLGNDVCACVAVPRVPAAVVTGRVGVAALALVEVFRGGRVIVDRAVEVFGGRRVIAVPDGMVTAEEACLVALVAGAIQPAAGGRVCGRGPAQRGSGRATAAGRASRPPRDVGPGRHIQHQAAVLPR